METPAEGSNAPGSFDWAKKHEKEGRSDFQKYISVGYHITIIIFGFLMLLLAWLAYDSLNTYSDAIDDFQENWETIPIVDIKTSTTECPEGYESLIDREWPGTVSGCDCHQASFGYSHYKDLDTGHCSSNQTRDGCRDVHSTHKAPLDKFYGVRICGYRAGANFVQIERPFKLAGEISCPNGYKICGSGDPSHIICVNQGEQCPINDVKILMNGETPEPGYQTITLDHTLDIKLAFTSDSSGLPVVRFRLTEGQVCADPDIYMMSEGRYPYELLRNEDYHQCDKEVADGYFDTRYENIGSVNEERLLKDNGLYVLLSNLPLYPIEDAKKYTWNLYSNRYNFWNAECEYYQDINRESMMNLLNSTSDQADFQLIVLIVTTIYAIVCCVVLELISLCMICQKGKENSKFQMISFGTVLVLLLVLTYLFWNCVSSSNGFEKEMTEIRETECSSNYDNLMFKNYGDTLVSGRSYNCYLFNRFEK